MINISDACTINITSEWKWCLRIIIDDSRVMLPIVASLLDDSRAIINIHNMFIVQSINLIFIWTKRGEGKVNCVACTINARQLLINDQHKWRLYYKHHKWVKMLPQGWLLSDAPNCGVTPWWFQRCHLRS